MQFVESSFIGLRSAVHIFQHGETGHEVLIFPMIHIGDPKFYETVRDEVAGCDFFITEGVNSPRKGKKPRKNIFVTLLTSSYMIPTKRKRLGLVPQNKSLKISELKGEVIWGDVNAKDFMAEWKKDSPFQVLLKLILSPLFGVYIYLFGNREDLIKILNVNDLPSRNDILTWSEENENYKNALGDFRNSHLKKIMKTHFEKIGKKKTPKKTAIVYEAKHMGFIVHALEEEFGYKVKSSKWIMAMEI